MSKIITRIKKGIQLLITEGPLTLVYILKQRKMQRNSKDNLYYEWIKINEQDIFKTIKLEYNPLISILIPVFNVKSEQLIECIESVRNQTYSNWELCIADDASNWENVKTILKRYENQPKIKIVYRKENGHISRATNSALGVASGEFIAFLDCDDVLSVNALYEMAKKLNENPEYDFIYSDEDKITEDGKARHMPHFKPDWSPDTLMSHMYTCHFGMYRRNIANDIGGIRPGYEGAQDYDFTLRFTEKTSQIGHIPKILYHWRERKESTAINTGAKPYILDATKKSKEDAIKRRGLQAELESINDVNQYRINYINSNNPLVSIIIPSKDNYDIIYKCINSIKSITKYQNYEIIVVDNGSNNENKLRYQSLCKEKSCLYYYERMKFNFSRMCNIGAKLSHGEIYLFLNDDIEVINDIWLERLVGQASLPHVGAVGAKLLYPNSTRIQHIGIININAGPVHNFAGYDDNNCYYFLRNKIDYNYVAVTGACLMIEKNKFKRVNGFDERFPVAYNDVELCFKLIKKGYYNIVRNDVILFHHESVSRGNDNSNIKKSLRLKEELKQLYNLYPSFDKVDPFYSPNLTQNRIDFSLNLTDINKFDSYNNIISTNNLRECKNEIVYCIDKIDYTDKITITGWAFQNNKILQNFKKVRVLLIGCNNERLIFDTYKIYRPDVSTAFKKRGSFNFTGFTCNIDANLLNASNYKIGICYDNKYIITKEKIQL